MAEAIPLAFEREQEIYTVSKLNALVRDLLEINFTDIWIEGEISNYKKYPSGHHYFTLKDSSSEISAVMFAGAALHLSFEPEDGMQVLIQGTVTVYLDRGRYQIIARQMKPAGLGKLQLAFEQLKEKLRAEGLFDAEHKKPLPQAPERIGIITSSTGAAIRDMLSIFERRFPLVEVLIFPVKVQGEGAAEEISSAVELANRVSEESDKIDILITGRGGGSLEDLWAFNEEIVARAIFNSAIPVVSAVGHEVDFTIADFVADLRAPTPSAAAELVVPDVREIRISLADSLRRLGERTHNKLESLRITLERYISSYAFRRPVQRVLDQKQKLDYLSESLLRAFRSRHQSLIERFGSLLGRLDAVNPAAVMQRGYSVIEDKSGNLIRSIDQVELNQQIDVRLHKGRLHCEVLDKFES